jgi:hypothetical protein
MACHVLIKAIHGFAARRTIVHRSRQTRSDHSKQKQSTTAIRVHPEMADFDSEQGLSDLETAGIVDYFEDFQRAKTPLGV